MDDHAYVTFADLAQRLGWALFRNVSLLPPAPRKGSIKPNLDHCMSIARRQVEELETRGMVEIYQRVSPPHSTRGTPVPERKQTEVTTYTVVSPVDESCVYGRGLTTLQAAEAVLTHDGYSYEIRRADPNRMQWGLWVSTAPAAVFRETPYMKRAAIPSVWAPTAEEAWAEIAALVVQHCRSWADAPELMTDQEYERMMRGEEARG